jgi:hypothetical protein
VDKRLGGDAEGDERLGGDVEMSAWEAMWR